MSDFICKCGIVLRPMDPSCYSCYDTPKIQHTIKDVVKSVQPDTTNPTLTFFDVLFFLIFFFILIIFFINKISA